jgi:hypothetical protein
MAMFKYEKLFGKTSSYDLVKSNISDIGQELRIKRGLN